MADYWPPLTNPASVYQGIYPASTPPAIPASPSRYDPIGAGPSWAQFDDYVNNTDAFRGPPQGVSANPLPSGTTYYPGNPSDYGYNSRTGNYELKRAGEMYTSVPARSAAGPNGVPAKASTNPLPKPSRYDPINPLGGPSWEQFDDYINNTGAFGGRSGSPAVITLASEPMSDVSGQNTANSFGKPVRGPSGKTYYPSNVPMSGVRPPYDPKAADKYATGSMSARDTRGPLSKLFGLKTSGLGGLLGGLFGGMLGGGAPAMGGGSAVSPGLGYNAAYSQSAPGDGQGNNAFSSSDGRYGGARSLTE